VVILELIHAEKPRLLEGVYLLDKKPMAGNRLALIHNNCADRTQCDKSIEFLPYQLWMVGYGPTMALTGNGELGFDSGEGALETATTSKEGSRRVNYPILIQGGENQIFKF